MALESLTLTAEKTSKGKKEGMFVLFRIVVHLRGGVVLQEVAVGSRYEWIKDAVEKGLQVGTGFSRIRSLESKF